MLCYEFESVMGWAMGIVWPEGGPPVPTGVDRSSTKPCLGINYAVSMCSSFDIRYQTNTILSRITPPPPPSFQNMADME